MGEQWYELILWHYGLLRAIYNNIFSAFVKLSYSALAKS